MATETQNTGSTERLQKLLARAGVASRRAAEEMIVAGKVRVNGVVVTEMGTRANPAIDKIEVDGRPLKVSPITNSPEQFSYILLNKPTGIVTTARDTHDRPTVLDIIYGRLPGSDQPGPNAADAAARTHRPTGKGAVSPPRPNRRSDRNELPAIPRVFPVGRLDIDTTGLLLLTNDGDLTFRLTHPRFGVEKEYHALVRGRPSPAAMQSLRKGVDIEGEMTAPAKVDEIKQVGDNVMLRVIIHEGRKRQIRLMCSAVGNPVISLQRVRFGPLPIGNLQPGQWRYLATHEIHALRRAVRLMR
ncbi:MAG: pseudouridine synthase [Chloroflexota bacterium]